MPERYKSRLTKYESFPYSRHSSYNELCHLVEAFKPKNIHPCTVDEANWTPVSSMSFLFGHIYDFPVSFRHDQMMFKKRGLGANAQPAGSKPGSAGSSSSSYETPGAGQPHLASRQAPQEIKNSTAPAVADKPSSRGSESDVPSRKRKNLSDLGHVGYWGRRSPPPGRSPPLIDHYSPTSDRRRHQAHLSPPPDAGESSDDLNSACWPSLTRTDVAYDTRLQNRWHKRISEATSRQDKDDRFGSSTTRAKNRKSRGSGRLSPPGVFRHDAVDGAAIQDHFNKRLRRQRAQETDGFPRPTSSSLSLGSESKMAYRREAYSAALESDGYTWSDIGLVSVNGHQAKEEEL